MSAAVRFQCSQKYCLIIRKESNACGRSNKIVYNIDFKVHINYSDICSFACRRWWGFQCSIILVYIKYSMKWLYTLSSYHFINRKLWWFCPGGQLNSTTLLDRTGFRGQRESCSNTVQYILGNDYVILCCTLQWIWVFATFPVLG